jgi:hypothetical protein
LLVEAAEVPVAVDAMPAPVPVPGVAVEVFAAEVEVTMPVGRSKVLATLHAMLDAAEIAGSILAQ